MKPQTTVFILLLFLQISLYSQIATVTTNADRGAGSVLQAITDINAGVMPAITSIYTFPVIHLLLLEVIFP